MQNALNAQRVAGLIKTAETMGILDTSSESTKQSDIDEILGFLAALEKVNFKVASSYRLETATILISKEIINISRDFPNSLLANQINTCQNSI